MAGNIAKCGSCGKQYRIPDGFLADELECKACGEIIPLAEPEEQPRRRGRREAPPKKSNLPLILGGAGAVLVVVVLIIVMGTGGNGGATSADLDADKGADTPVKKEPVVEPEPEPTDYGGADLQARIEYADMYKLLPKKPREPKSRGGGVVSNEAYAKWMNAKTAYRAKRKVMYAEIAEKAMKLVSDFPGSAYEWETAEKAVFQALFNSEQYEKVVQTAIEYKARFGAKIAMKANRFSGDALDKLERYEESAASYGEYVETANNASLHKAAIKQVGALVKAGKSSEAQQVGAELGKRSGRAEPRIQAILRPLALVGRPLKATPGAKPILSEDDVDWASYKGGPLLVVIWSTQFDACHEPIKTVSNLIGTIDGLKVVGVVLEEKSQDREIEGWLRDKDVRDFPQIVQRGRFCESKLMLKWGLAWENALVALPLTIVVDKRGMVRYVGVPAGAHLAKLIKGMK
jgi:hypothetical protein